MIHEIFRAMDISTYGPDGPVLSDVSFNLFEGETLGVFGVANSGKTALMDVMARIVLPVKGSIFINGRVARPFDKPVDGRIVRFYYDTLLLDEMTIWENILVVRKHVTGHLGLRPRLLKKHMKLLLEEMELDFTPDSPVDSLSDSDRFIAELFKAWSMGAKLVLMDHFSFDFTPAEYKKINSFMSRLKGLGMTFVISSCRLESLKSFTDRIIFLSDNQIVKIMKNDVSDYGTMEDILAASFSPRPLRHTKLADKADRSVYRLEFATTSGKPLNISVTGGEIFAIVDLSKTELRAFYGPFGERISGITASCSEKDVMFLEFALDAFLIDTLSPLDNLCFGLFNRFSFLGCPKKRILKNLADEFAAWSGNSELMTRRSCIGLTKQEKADILMFRLLLKRPKLLVCRIANQDQDILTHNTIIKGLVSLAETGTAVCFLSDVHIKDDTIDKCLVITENWMKIVTPQSSVSAFTDEEVQASI